MSPNSAQRFWENDMHQNKDLKRVARLRFNATRFRLSHDQGMGLDVRRPFRP